MSEVELDSVVVVVTRRRRSAEERLQIVEQSYVHGMSVARVARKYGINANQVFQWRRLQQKGTPHAYDWDSNFVLFCSCWHRGIGGGRGVEAWADCGGRNWTRPPS